MSKKQPDLTESACDPTQEDTDTASEWVRLYWDEAIVNAVDSGDGTMLAVELSYLLARMRSRGAWDSMQGYGMKPRTERP